MKRFLLAAVLTVAGFSNAFAVQLEAKLSPDPVQMGKQTLLVQVKNDKGKVAADAKLSARAVMPATPDMMEMVSVGKIEKEAPGKYQIRFNISMEGTWFLNVDVTEGKETKTFVYEVTTGKPGFKKAKP